MWDIPTKDLVEELYTRYDLFFMVGMLADPPSDDESFDYWVTAPFAATSILTQYALSHYAIQQVKANILAEDSDNA
jgi:hypothetical protein